MPPHHSIPLYPHPPSPQTRADRDPPSDELDFPPIRERASTPKDRYNPSPLRSQLPNKSLGHKNVVNTVHVNLQESHCDCACKVDCQNPRLKASKKRQSLQVQVEDSPGPSKRRRLTVDKDDMDWVKNEISDMKDCMEGVAEQIREEVIFQLAEIIYRIEQIA